MKDDLSFLGLYFLSSKRAWYRRVCLPWAWLCPSSSICEFFPRVVSFELDTRHCLAGLTPRCALPRLNARLVLRTSERFYSPSPSSSQATGSVWKCDHYGLSHCFSPLYSKTKCSHPSKEICAKSSTDLPVSRVSFMNGHWAEGLPGYSRRNPRMKFDE